MQGTRHLVCLAKSRKNKGFCLAGKEVSSSGYGMWMRPVGETLHGELLEADLLYDDGGSVSVCDTFLVSLKGYSPHQYQGENFLINNKCYCTKTGKIKWEDLKEIEKSEIRNLWVNGYNSSHGINDKVPLSALSYPDKSLRLIFLQKAIISYQKEFNGKRKCRLEFDCYNSRYRLVVTDPEIENLEFEKQEGSYDLKDAYCCVSLGEPFEGYAYKLVASIITKERINNDPFIVYYRTF